jgi:hypothetical protein
MHTACPSLFTWRLHTYQKAGLVTHVPRSPRQVLRPFACDHVKCIYHICWPCRRGNSTLELEHEERTIMKLINAIVAGPSVGHIVTVRMHCKCVDQYM